MNTQPQAKTPEKIESESPKTSENAPKASTSEKKSNKDTFDQIESDYRTDVHTPAVNNIRKGRPVYMFSSIVLSLLAPLESRLFSLLNSSISPEEEVKCKELKRKMTELRRAMIRG